MNEVQSISKTKHRKLKEITSFGHVQNLWTRWCR